MELALEPVERLADLRARLECLRDQVARIGRAMRRDERAMSAGERQRFADLTAEIDAVRAEVRELAPKLAVDDDEHDRG